MEGVEWVFKYYTVDCPDWRWKYKYDYPPLLCDLYEEVKKREEEEEEEEDEYSLLREKGERPFEPIVQLMYVLPPSAQGLLPLKVVEMLEKEYKELFPKKIKFQWAFCRYLWEAHIKLPDISLSILEKWNEEIMLLSDNSASQK